MYQVYQNGIPADCFGYPKVHKSWNKSKFHTKREAEIYAWKWCYHEPENIAPEMDLEKEYDYSMCEFPVLMKIVYVKE